MEDFLAVVEKMGLNRVSYAIGWTARLDIAADGVNKATAMEPVRIELGIAREPTNTTNNWN
jgi:hydroxymethylpyrimidine pyrophosphatase-like HAD family hydrolase